MTFNALRDPYRSTAIGGFGVDHMAIQWGSIERRAAPASGALTTAATASRSWSVRRREVVEQDRPFRGRHLRAEVDHLVDCLLPFRPRPRSDNSCRRVALAAHILKNARWFLPAREGGGSQPDPQSSHWNNISKWDHIGLAQLLYQLVKPTCEKPVW
jgi:hypothetical protein